MSEILISLTGNQKKSSFFCKCFLIHRFFLIYVPHIWQCNARNVFFTWIYTRIVLVMSHLWKTFQGEMVHGKTYANKAHNFFWFPVWDIEISDIFYKIQKFIRISWAPIITTNGIHFLMAGPLQYLTDPV